MDNNAPTGDQISAFVSSYFLGVLAVGFLVWLICACIALIVAPNDRPWSFFWCTLLFLGPLGIALALIAPSRPTGGEND
jgi:hypothetical protein